MEIYIYSQGRVVGRKFSAYNTPEMVDLAILGLVHFGPSGERIVISRFLVTAMCRHKIYLLTGAWLSCKPCSLYTQKKYI